MKSYPSKNIEKIVSYVKEHPGCTKWDVAAHIAEYRFHPSDRSINRAIERSLIYPEKVGRHYALYVPEW